MKRCPRCQTILTEARIGSVQVDGCGRCGGVWFENGELATAANTTSTDLLALEDQFLPGPSASGRQASTVCPTCNVNLYQFEYPHLPGVRLDACPQCMGVWADDGELKVLYARMTGAAPEAVRAGVETRRAGRQALGALLSRPCPHCKRPNAAAAATCMACGHRLPQAGTPLCPNCDVGLKPINYRGISLDVCPHCTGVWLDPGELSSLSECTPDALGRLQDEGAIKRDGVSALWNANPSLMCPRCCVPLAAPDQVYGANVSLDSCLHCNGVWVGAGNLPAISRDYRQSLGRRSLL